MEKVFHFDVPRANYHCDAAVVWCFDDRFHLGFSKFLKRLRVTHPDRIKIAGGAKSLAAPDREWEREFVLDQIRKSVRLHGTRRVILMMHSDCGAYGGLAGGFGGSPEREAQHLEHDLLRASLEVKKAVPGIEVQAFFVDFEGIWSVDVGQSRAVSVSAASTA